MKRARGLTALMLAAAVGKVVWSAEGTAAVPATRLYLSYGDYMTGFNDMHGMVQTLVAKNHPDLPGLTRLGLGIGAHGDTIAIWKSGVFTWIRHPSPRDSYLFAYAVACRILGGSPAQFPAPDAVFAGMNEKISRENEKNKGKGGEPKPLVTMTGAEQAAIHEAVAKAIASFDAATQ